MNNLNSIVDYLKVFNNIENVQETRTTNHGPGTTEHGSGWTDRV